MKNAALSVEELKNLTVKELLEIAKKYDIKGRHDMKKSALIDHIEMAHNQVKLEKEQAEKFNELEKQNLEQRLEQTKQTTHKCQTGEMDEVEILGQRETGKTRSDYVNKLEIGQIIAFDLIKEKAMSAKVTNVIRDADGQIKYVLCESKRGTQYKVPAAKIIWVKTGTKFPRPIYEKLIKHTTNKNDE